MFVSNNHTSFYLWWKANLVKRQKVSKYYENDCQISKKLSKGKNGNKFPSFQNYILEFYSGYNTLENQTPDGNEDFNDKNDDDYTNHNRDDNNDDK